MFGHGGFEIDARDHHDVIAVQLAEGRRPKRAPVQGLGRERGGDIPNQGEAGIDGRTEIGVVIQTYPRRQNPVGRKNPFVLDHGIPERARFLAQKRRITQVFHLRERRRDRNAAGADAKVSAFVDIGKPGVTQSPRRIASGDRVDRQTRR